MPRKQCDLPAPGTHPRIIPSQRLLLLSPPHQNPLLSQPSLWARNRSTMTVRVNFHGPKTFKHGAKATAKPCYCASNTNSFSKGLAQEAKDLLGFLKRGRSEMRSKSRKKGPNSHGTPTLCPETPRTFACWSTVSQMGLLRLSGHVRIFSKFEGWGSNQTCLSPAFFLFTTWTPG